MRTTILLALLCIPFCIVYSQGSLLKGMYGFVEYSCSQDTVALNASLNELQEKNPEQYQMVAGQIRASNELISLFSCNLYFNNNQSYSNISSEVEGSDASNSFQLQLARISLKGDATFFLDMTEREKLYEKSLDRGSSYVHVKLPYHDISWNVTSDQKKIGKYVCRKATGTITENSKCCGLVEKTITAWFTPEIPLPFGPMRFNGLPGLILVAETGDKIPLVYRATSINIENNSQKDIPSLKKPSQVLTQEELESQLNERIQRMKRQN